MIAFGRSLHHLKVVGCQSFRYVPLEAPLNQRPLDQVTIGNWSLPSLKSLRLRVETNAVIKIERFDECPRLQTLSINYNFPTSRRQRPTPSIDTYPVFLSPVWKLPYLRSLELHCEAAMLFDFDSLDYMPALQQLVLVTPGDFQSVPTSSVPRLAAYSCHVQPSGNAEADPTSDLVVGTKWKDCWDLPRLTHLHLDGPQSSVFCFKWLARCPSLESIRLVTRGAFQRLPLWSSSENASILPIEKSSEPSMDDSGFDPKMAPLVKSKLRSIVLLGPWVVSSHDLSKVLTFYTPNLTSLRVDRIHAVDGQQEKPWHGIQFVKTVANAIGMGDGSDQTKVEMSGSASKYKPGSKLKEIVTAYTIKAETAKELGKIGLVEVSKETWKKCQEMGARGFEFRCDCFIREEDKCASMAQFKA